MALKYTERLIVTSGLTSLHVVVVIHSVFVIVTPALMRERLLTLFVYVLWLYRYNNIRNEMLFRIYMRYQCDLFFKKVRGMCIFFNYKKLYIRKWFDLTRHYCIGIWKCILWNNYSYNILYLWLVLSVTLEPFILIQQLMSYVNCCRFVRMS